VLALLAAVVAAIVAVVIVTRRGSAQAAQHHATDPAGAATVQRRDLVETDTESGTLSYNNPQTVYDSLDGTLTWLPQVGQVIKPGHALFKVDDQPVLLMNGTTPAFRELSASDTPGSDIEQLNRDLVKLGFNRANIVVDDEWQYATTVGVEELQAAHDLTETGTLTLGQVVFLPGAQLVGTLETTVGSGGGGGGSASGSSSSSSGSSSSGTPSSSGSATAIMQTSSTQLVATVDLDASKQSEARVGEKVTVQMPSGSFVNGRVIAVSPVAQNASSSGSGGGGSSGGGSSSSSSSSSSSGSSSTVPVTIALHGHHNGVGLDQAAVSVNFAQARANNVLSIPVTALLARAGGGYAVQEAAAPHKLIVVKVGLFAAGYVQISGAGVYPGLRVTDSQG
jgi:hypothetical protein